MFLLIHLTLYPNMEDEFIYIPLCFYLYSPSAAANREKLPDLHSTMFLLIQKTYAEHVIAEEFTFHYVSTYTSMIGS